MALLTEPEITAIWQMIYKRGQGEEEIKTTGLPSRSERTKFPTQSLWLISMPK